MRKTLNLILALVALHTCILMGASTAAARTNEFTIAMGSLAFGGGSTTWDLNANYEFDVVRWLMAGGKLKFNRSEAGSITFSSWSIIATATFNFSAIVATSIYVQGEFGFKRSVATGAGTSSSETQGGLGMVLGKRFVLSPPIIYKPNIGFTKYGSSGMSIVINALSFSILF